MVDETEAPEELKNQEMHYEYAEDTNIEENDIYAECSREELVDEDCISAEEAAFMQGYEEAV